MIGIIYNKQNVYSTGCGLLAFLERRYIFYIIQGNSKLSELSCKVLCPNFELITFFWVPMSMLYFHNLIFNLDFSLLVYFFWLLNTILLYYFTNKFQLNNIIRYFRLMAIISFLVPFLISSSLFFISLSSIQIYSVNNSM